MTFGHLPTLSRLQAFTSRLVGQRCSVGCARRGPAAVRLSTFIFVLLGALWPALELAAAANAKPNVIFFLADDISWNDLGCYG